MTAPFVPPVLPEPAAAPERLAMPDQRFDRPFRDPAAPGPAPVAGLAARRATLAALALAITAGMAALTFDVMAADGAVSGAEWAILAMTLPLAALLSVSAGTAVLGFARPAPAAPAGAGEGLTVAILVTLYGEPPRDSIAPAVRLAARLASAPGRHRFALRFLSDTRDAAAAAAEADMVRGLARLHPGLDVTWRRRGANTDFKPGNIRDWVRAEGHLFDAALVLDADSTMTPQAVAALADALADDPGCGLVQSVVAVRPGRTLWQRLQAFAAEVYGTAFARGYAAWTGQEGNFFGHNAILRTRAFAAAAGLPRLGRGEGAVPILSHDFVEAALLRRAGWGVRVLAVPGGSDEGAPATLPAHIRRDRRWCRGNLQHLRLLAVSGLHPLSRLHLALGAAAYLVAPHWLALMALWAATPSGGGGSAGPLVAATAALLLVPRLICAAAWLRDRGAPPRGRRAAFAGALAAELAVSVLAAPVLMVHQIRAVFSAATGIGAGGWSPHLTDRPPFAALLRFHAAETAAGLGLLALVAGGVANPWLLPVALALACAAPLAWAVQQELPPGVLEAAPRAALRRGYSDITAATARFQRA